MSHTRGPNPDQLLERTAQLIAHRVCCGTEADPLQGKLHGYCVVCGVPWPCSYASQPPAAPDGLDLAKMVAKYFGESPIDELLDADIALRDAARAIIAKAEAK
ncbi:MAG: hypothetical protein ACJ71S_06440 [Acidobacteriaceae bacterium]